MFIVRLTVSAIASIFLIPVSSAIPADSALQAEARVLLASPDVRISDSCEFQARPDVVQNLLRSPILIARLWEAYNFSPAYKASPKGNGIHVDDPTGIAGDVYPVEEAANRRVYVGTGSLNHNLVPAFGGKMAVVLTTIPKGSAVSARIDVFIRTDSRILGFLARTMFPLLKTRAEYRITMNAKDIGTILEDLSVEPRKTAARLNRQDEAALLKILPVPPAPAAVRPTVPARKK